MTGRVLITGGAGFIGANLAASYLREGHRVVVLDSLVRDGAAHNLRWLRECDAGGGLTHVQADVRDAAAVFEAAAGADIIYHLAGQVGVTTSIANPRADFECNALGTLNVLEAARLGGRRPSLVFASTNKVYGALDGVEIVQTDTRYECRALSAGVSETQPLDFHSPYGCSKGAADQYVRDYARVYGVPTVCFRISCVYGPRQFGTEDQGWVAHFIIAALTEQPVTIFGDGRQVRDILFIDDLVRAFRMATERIAITAGEVFNIGGGPANTLAIWQEFGPRIAALKGHSVPAFYGPARAGDQRWYVSDIRKAERVLGWRPQVDTDEGIRRLWEWVSANRVLFPPALIAQP
jgi:CDP-paratose 2-epimerase